MYNISSSGHYSPIRRGCHKFDLDIITAINSSNACALPTYCLHQQASIVIFVHQTSSSAPIKRTQGTVIGHSSWGMCRGVGGIKEAVIRTFASIDHKPLVEVCTADSRRRSQEGVDCPVALFPCQFVLSHMLCFISSISRMLSSARKQAANSAVLKKMKPPKKTKQRPFYVHPPRKTSAKEGTKKTKQGPFNR